MKLVQYYLVENFNYVKYSYFYVVSIKSRLIAYSQSCF